MPYRLTQKPLWVSVPMTTRAERQSMRDVSNGKTLASKHFWHYTTACWFFSKKACLQDVICPSSLLVGSEECWQGMELIWRGSAAGESLYIHVDPGRLVLLVGLCWNTREHLWTFHQTNGECPFLIFVHFHLSSFFDILLAQLLKLYRAFYKKSQNTKMKIAGLWSMLFVMKSWRRHFVGIIVM